MISSNRLLASVKTHCKKQGVPCDTRLGPTSNFKEIPEMKGNILFNDAQKYIYGYMDDVRHMVKD